MKVLSLWQPWASAMALGLKRIETRHWTTYYRGPIAIHAAKRWTADERELLEIEHEAGRMPAAVPLGALVAVARLVDVRPTEQLVGGLTEQEEGWGNYGRGRFGWLMDDICPLAAPIPLKGFQGLFDLPDVVLSGGAIPAEFIAAEKPKPAAKVSRQADLFGEFA